MGYNRSGERRKQRLKRQKREINRLLAKIEKAPAPAKPAPAKRVAEKPAPEKPAAEKPAATKPVAEKAAPAKPAGGAKKGKPEAK